MSLGPKAEKQPAKQRAREDPPSRGISQCKSPEGAKIKGAIMAQHISLQGEWARGVKSPLLLQGKGPSIGQWVEVEGSGKRPVLLLPSSPLPRAATGLLGALPPG